MSSLNLLQYVIEHHCRTEVVNNHLSAAIQSLGWCPPFFLDGRPPVLGSVARGGCPLEPGGSWAYSRLTVESDCCRALGSLSVRFVLAVDLSTQHQHPVRARGTWDFALPGARRLNNSLHRTTDTLKLKRQFMFLPCDFAGSGVSATPHRLRPGAPWTVAAQGTRDRI